MTCTSAQKLSSYPILFGFGEVVVGRGFVAGVAITHGRILARQEDEGWWLDGVNPGALTAGARSLHEGVAKFRSIFRGVLSDLAEESEDFNQFEGAVKAFFEATDEEAVREWEAAREVVRSRSGQSAPLDLQIDTFDSKKMAISVKVISAPRENLVQEDAPALAA